MFDFLTQLIETAKADHKAFDIEPLMSGSIALWHVPRNETNRFEAQLKQAFERECLEAQRRLISRGLKVVRKVYQITIHKAVQEGEHIVNYRIAVAYTGPSLAGIGKIIGVYDKKPELWVWLQDLIAKIVQSLVSSPAKSDEMTVMKPIMITQETPYAKMVGIFTAYEMKIKITPNRKEYVPIIQRNMPQTIANITLTYIKSDKTSIYYHMNAAGRPYLERIGAVITRLIQMEPDRKTPLYIHG